MPEIKATRSVAESKLDTPLRLRLQGRGSDGTQTRPFEEAMTSDDPVMVQIDGTISPALADAVAAAHGTVIDQSPRWSVMRATLPLSSVLAIAELPDVRRIRLPPRALTN